MTNADAATVASVCTLIGVVAQTVANQWGADRARKHEIELTRLKMEDDDEHEVKTKS